MNEKTDGVVERDVDLAAVEQKAKETPTQTQTITLVREPGQKGPVTRGQFLMAAKMFKPKTVIVDLPEPLEGGQIKVKELTAGERDLYEGRLVKGRLGKQKIDMTELRIGLIIAACVDWDDETTPLFNDKDREMLKGMGIKVIQAIYSVASELSAVSKDDEDELLGE